MGMPYQMYPMRWIPQTYQRLQILTETPDTTENPNTENPDNSSLDNMSNEDMDADPTDSEYSPNPTVRLYPNPASDRIYVKTDQIEIVKFQLFSSRGTLVQEVGPAKTDQRYIYVMDIPHRYRPASIPFIL